MGPEILPHPRLLKFVKPQREWKWEIAIYLYLAGMGAGSFIIGVFLGWFGYGLNPSKTLSLFGFSMELSRAFLLWGPLLVAIGAPFLILDLGIKRRFLYACLNPKTSWVARGFLILSTFIVLGLLVFALNLLAPDWTRRRTGLLLVLEFVSVLFAFSTALYTGVLLKSVRYVPVWNTAFLPLLFLVSALSTGSMGIILSSMSYGLLFSGPEWVHSLIQKLIGVEQGFVFLEAVVLALYLYMRYQAKDQGETSVHLLLRGNLRLLFWGGIVGIGFIFPIVLEYLYSHTPGYPAILFVTGMSLLVGGFFLRLGVLAAGVKEQLPMHKYIEIKYQLGAVKKSASPER